MMLAQILPTTLPDPGHYSSIGWVCVIVFCLVAGARQITGFWRELRGKDPEPPNEQLENSRRELERRVSAAESAIGEVWKNISHDRESGEENARSRSAGIYKKIDEVRAEVSGKVDELRNQMTMQFKDTERALGRIEGKLNS
jgi:hypothetical protein